MAYDFVKASSQYLSINDTNVLDITGQITLACWVKRGSDLTTEQQLIVKYENSAGKPNQRSYLMAISTSGLLLSRFGRDGTAINVSGRNSASSVSSDWSHLATTWTPNVQDANLYINGALSNGSGQNVTSSAIHSGTANLTLGARSDGGGAYFGGQMAEVGIWNASLTADEIASLTDGMTCDKVRPQSLQFYAPLVRSLQDVRGGLTITNNNGATVANHPRVYA